MAISEGLDLPGAVAADGSVHARDSRSVQAEAAAKPAAKKRTSKNG